MTNKHLSMTNDQNKVIAVFDSNHETLQAEKIFKENQIPIKPTIKPRKIASSCTLALEFEKKFSDKVTALSIANKLSIKGIFKRENDGWIKT